MDIQFAIICTCIITLAVLDFRSTHKKLPTPRLWLLSRLMQAGRDGSLGPPRLKMIRGEWYVLGCGRRILVTTKAEGYRLMARMRREMNKTVKALPADKQKNQIVLL